MNIFRTFLLAFVFYGLCYICFELFFNWVSELFDDKYPWEWKRKLKPRNAPSLFMFIPGGLCGLLMHFWLLIPFDFSNIFTIILTCVVGCITITGIELLSGYILNIRLKMDIWKYTSSIKIFNHQIQLNFLNQIDVWHSLGWLFMPILFIIIDKSLF